MKILTEAGRNKHGQRLVRAECPRCGREFVALENNVKSGRTKSCGQCAKPAKKTQPQPASEIAPESESKFERNSPAWFAERIALKEDAAIAAENRARILEEKLKAQTCTDLDTHKEWNTESTTARKLWADIARLRTAKDKAETATVKDARSVAEITKDKIAALKGSK